MFRTIREKNTGMYVPGAAARPLAAVWDWLAASTPIRGPLMFSSDYLAEMQVGGGGWGCAMWDAACSTACRVGACSLSPSRHAPATHHDPTPTPGTAGALHAAGGGAGL